MHQQSAAPVVSVESDLFHSVAVCTLPVNGPFTLHSATMDAPTFILSVFGNSWDPLPPHIMVWRSVLGGFYLYEILRNIY